MPRYRLLSVPEFATAEAPDHYLVRKSKIYNEFAALRAQAQRFTGQLMPHLERLDALIEAHMAVNCQLSRDDVRVLPLLRSAAVVEGLKFPGEVQAYFETLVARKGYTPLPRI